MILPNLTTPLNATTPSKISGENPGVLRGQVSVNLEFSMKIKLLQLGSSTYMWCSSLSGDMQLIFSLIYHMLEFYVLKFQRRSKFWKKLQKIVKKKMTLRMVKLKLEMEKAWLGEMRRKMEQMVYRMIETAQNNQGYDVDSWCIMKSLSLPNDKTLDLSKLTHYQMTEF